ncbi:TlpA disulfide reductase family protein [Marimonas arenosa]|uniref:TlpA family protein disulfide reductase n=1 Tax=Marimonas arenosa TaxID=1795305 RepID=A0AAE3WF12_9RHOB|nr:TlpA disulfide reductase family protein [Marimonas arenosa]MDQ2092071.1 TlpA family protein disulfide reductase [Marimonas arenosa]
MSRPALLYTALAAIAIAALAFVALRDPAQPIPETALNHAKLEGLRDGTMKKLAFHASAKTAGTAAYDTAAGGKAVLADHQGRYVLVNFWATWCAPCRKEMPALAELQAEFGGDDFEVLTIATGRNNPAQMKKFFDEIGVDNLPLHRDPTQSLAREMGILGLPVTVILDPRGREIARMVGDAEWASDSGKAIIRTLIEG